jgi:hypothetical protein
MLLIKKINKFNIYYTQYKSINSLYLSIKRSLNNITTIGISESIN